LPRRQSCGSLLQRLDDGIVHKRPDLADGLRHAVGPGAVGQQRHRKLARGIDPQRGAGESEMPKGRSRKMSARRCRRRRSVPSQRPRRTGRSIDATREELHRFRLEEGRPAAQHARSEMRDIDCRSENAGVSGDASHHEGVLVIHFTLNDAPAKGAIVLRGRNLGLPFRRWIESRLCHAKWDEDLLPRELVECKASLATQHFSQQEEADVTVFGVRAGLGDQPRGKRGPNQFLARAGNLEQLLVSRQPAGVREQHAQGDRLSRGLLMPGRARHKIREKVPERNVQRQLAALVEQHGHGRGRHDLGQGSQIEDGVGLNQRRVVSVGEAAKSAQRDQRPVMSNGQRRGGKGALLDGVANQGKSPDKLFVLELESRWQFCELLRHWVHNHLWRRLQLIIACRRNGAAIPRSRKVADPLRLRSWPVIALLLLVGFVITSSIPLLAQKASAPAVTPSTTVNAADRFAPLDALLKDAVEKGRAPGAVVLVGHNGNFVYRKAFGYRALDPSKEPMTVDTIFDMASLTKVMATTSCVMRLVQLGQVKLNDPVAKYIPEFAHNGKDDVTVRQLLTHYSGLRPDLDLKQYWSGLEEGYNRANAEKLMDPPGSVFVYSDINFVVLGELVQRVGGMPLDQYAQTYIFGPLGMTSTRFLPPADWKPRIAPTERDERTGQMLRGVVHDPTARRMGGVAGDAGLFSIADDVAKFAQALLNGGAPVFSPGIVEKMTTPQQPPNLTDVRGLGWDIDSPFSSNRGELLPVGSFGHTGFTGTSLWIDPATNTYIILLTNAVHIKDGNVIALRTEVATAVAAALQLQPSEEQKMRLSRITGYNEAAVASRRLMVRNGQVSNGIDELEANNFDVLRVPGAGTPKVGLVTNQTGVDSRGNRTIDVLAHARGLQLSAIFSPEHGVQGTSDKTDIADTKDGATGVTVYSVYGGTDAKRRPPLDVLRKLDVLVFDIQDAGVRFYTYETTLGYFLEAAATLAKPIVVLDRPNPITGAYVQGPVSDKGQESFVNYHPVPVRHGMTIGELAKLYNTERNINANLTVVPMKGWMRGDWFDSTSQLWVSPSPNLRDLNQATLYPAVALIEQTNVSVGRGTDTPFEVVGAPWVGAKRMAAFLNARHIAGVRFVPITFTPASGPYARRECEGVDIIVTNRDALDAPELGLELAAALHDAAPTGFDMAHMKPLLANQAAFTALQAGQDPRRIADDWRDGIEQFMQVRKKYLIY